VGLVVLAFNNHLVADVSRNVTAPFKAWTKHPNRVGPMTIKAPKFADRSQRHVARRGFDRANPDAPTMTFGRSSSKPGQRVKVKPAAKPFGAYAVGVQRARGL
jgi:hypothetical protein